MADDKNKQLFLSLIYSFQMQTMMHLGKLANPMTGQIERELDGAQATIDLLDMLKEKTKGNTSEDESRFLDQAIADLKLNYVEEREKEKTAPKEKEKAVEENASGKQDKPDKEKLTDADNELPPQE